MNQELPPKDEAGPELLGKPDSVRALVEFAETIALADEQDRQENLDGKAGTLAGLVAVALSIEVGLGASVLASDDLACAGRAVFITFLCFALAGLSTSGLIALLGILVPKGYPGLKAESISRLATRSEMDTDVRILNERRLSTVVEFVEGARKTNDKKAKWLSRASIALAAGIVAIAAQGLTLPFL